MAYYADAIIEQLVSKKCSIDTLVDEPEATIIGQNNVFTGLGTE